MSPYRQQIALASRQPRVAVYAATQSAADQQRYLLQGFAVLSVTLLAWANLLLG